MIFIHDIYTNYYYYYLLLLYIYTYKNNKNKYPYYNSINLSGSSTIKLYYKF